VLTARDVTYAVDGRTLLDRVSVAFAPGAVGIVVGPNGAGKSTLVKVVSGALVPAQGSVTVLGEPLARLGRKEIAQRIAVVPQSSEAPPGFSVREIVMMGRAPYQGAWELVD
jgi:iron complex transport system ATP-binding protein